jgi:hypothetical protein
MMNENYFEASEQPGKSAQPTTDKSPALQCWVTEAVAPESVKRTAEDCHRSRPVVRSTDFQLAIHDSQH